ncbi:MAG: ubiquinol cytochrome C oxidoreductase [Bacteroidota bacterium]
MMKTPIAIRSPHPAHSLLLHVMAFTFLLVWLPFLRSAFDGPSYQWGTSYFGIFFSGKGITPAYLFLVIQLVFYSMVFISIYWIRNRALMYVLTGLWFVHVFGNMMVSIARNPDAAFRGDTLGVNVPLLYIVIPLVLLAGALVYWMIQVDSKGPEVSIAWNKKNRLMALLVFGPLPLQWLLLHFGSPPSTLDKIGVLITIIQCLSIPFVLKPYPRQRV